VKTQVKHLPPLPDDTEPLTLLTLQLKAQFIQSVLTGLCVRQDDSGLGWADDYLVERAFEIGELAFETFVEENTVKKFNRKVGV
jgi:hypothetical protein